MSKRNRTILRRELDDLPMEEMVMEAMTGVGQTHRCTRIMADSLDCIVIVAVGPAAQTWLEISDGYRRAMDAGNGQADGEQEVGGAESQRGT